MSRRQSTSGYSGRRTRLTDTIKDISYAIGELTKARDELRAIAAVADTSPSDAAIIEPASRVGLACAFLREVECRMGWSRPIRDASAKDPVRSSSKRKGRSPDPPSVQGEPDGEGEDPDPVVAT